MEGHQATEPAESDSGTSAAADTTDGKSHMRLAVRLSDLKGLKTDVNRKQARKAHEFFRVHGRCVPLDQGSSEKSSSKPDNSLTSLFTRKAQGE